MLRTHGARQRLDRKRPIQVDQSIAVNAQFGAASVQS
jgi:hypothetical protein